MFSDFYNFQLDNIQPSQMTCFWQFPVYFYHVFKINGILWGLLVSIEFSRRVNFVGLKG